jgi:DNA-binding IclR family transcriptional regulator
MGTPFLAWASEEEIDAWIARRTVKKDEALVAEWRNAIEAIRRRGFQVTLSAPPTPEIATKMARLQAAGESADYKMRIFEILESFDHEGVQLDVIEPDVLYDVQIIDAPLFDDEGKVMFCLCVDGSRKFTGAEILRLADHLLRSAVDIMRVGRGANEGG